jgi:hypothetical protein
MSETGSQIEDRRHELQQDADLPPNATTDEIENQLEEEFGEDYEEM